MSHLYRDISRKAQKNKKKEGDGKKKTQNIKHVLVYFHHLRKLCLRLKRERDINPRAQSPFLHSSNIIRI